jgi:serine/threonine protein phosphatase PrpC
MKSLKKSLKILPLQSNNHQHSYKSQSAYATLPSISEESSQYSEHSPPYTSKPSVQKSKHSLSQSSENRSDLMHFGCLRFYAIGNSTDHQSNRNKIRVSLRLKQPETVFSGKWPPSSFFGLFEAKSGHQCASFLKDNLLQMISSDLQFPTRPKIAIGNAFRRADEEFLRIAAENVNFSAAFAGVVLLIGKKCFIAQTGNVKVFISMHNGQKILKLSQNHSCANEEERKRVLENGGTIYKECRIQKNGAKDYLRRCLINPGKRDYTRSFGDLDAKNNCFGGKEGVIVPEPYIKCFSVNENCDFIVMTDENAVEEGEEKEFVDRIWENIGKGEGFQERINSELEEMMRIKNNGEGKGGSSIVIVGLKDATTVNNEQ